MALLWHHFRTKIYICCHTSGDHQSCASIFHASKQFYVFVQQELQAHKVTSVATDLKSSSNANNICQHQKN